LLSSGQKARRAISFVCMCLIMALTVAECIVSPELLFFQNSGSLHSSSGSSIMAACDGAIRAQCVV
jgi:hypothetical protein